MRLHAAIGLWIALTVPAFADWQFDRVPTPGRVTAIDVDGARSRIAIGNAWYELSSDAKTLIDTPPPIRQPLPGNALPDGRVAQGHGLVARAWLSSPTKRYDHGVLGDAIEAGSLTLERADGRRGDVTLGKDAVFEDLTPRIVTIDGHERIVVVKSYLKRGSAVAIVDPDRMAIIAETPPIGHPHAWLNPAGVADYDGDGLTDIAIVRQPHVVGHLELWSFRNGRLIRTAEVADVANHVIGSRAIGMSQTADFDGDGHPDLAVPSLDRRSLRIIGFVPAAHDIARVSLPSRLATNIGLLTRDGKPALTAGTETGELLMISNH